MKRVDFPPIAELVPHTPPMLLVDELIAWTPDRAQVRAELRSSGAFVVDGELPAPVLLEYMAQAVAAAHGWRLRVERRPIVGGVLLGTRELTLEVEALAVGTVLDIHIEREFDEGDLARYRCRVDDGDGRSVATATLNVMSSPTKKDP